MSGVTTGSGHFFPDTHLLPMEATFILIMASVFKNAGAYPTVEAAVPHARSVYFDMLPDCGGVFGAEGYDWTIGAAKEWAAEDMRHWEYRPCA